MKIIFVTDYITKVTGGIRFLTDVLMLLARTRHFEVFIITGSSDEYSKYISSIPNLHLIDLNTYYKDRLPHQQIANIGRFIERARSVVKKLMDCESILHTNNHIPNFIPFLMNTKTPIVCSIHHLEQPSGTYSFLAKFGSIFIQDLEVNTRSSIIHVPSRYVKEIVQYKTIINKNKVIVIPPGIDLQQYLNVKKNVEDGLFLMIGRLTKRKHYDHVVAAFNIVKKYRPEAKLVIIGEGPQRKEIEAMIKRHNLDSSIKLLGKVSEKEKINLLARSEALIHLGYPEGFGIVIIEALASGTPVIAYDVPPINEIVVHHKTGVLVKKDSVTGLARAIIDIDRYNFHPDKLRRIAERYDIYIVARKFEKLYKYLVEPQR